MILFLHGYLLDGSGSNLWTRHILDHLGRLGLDVHLSCQEPHPERYAFIRNAERLHRDGSRETLFTRESGFVTLHKPVLGDTLPVYVRDQYEEFPRVVPMVDLDTEALTQYVEINFEALDRVCQRTTPKLILSNHTVLISEVARQLAAKHKVPFGVIPHGSALEYAVRKDSRLQVIAERIFRECDRVFLVSPEIGSRLRNYFPEVDFSTKTTVLSVGVDTGQFHLSAPENRPNQLAKLTEKLTHEPKGRTRSIEQSLRTRVREGNLPPNGEWQQTPYPTKAPDEGLVQKLEGWDVKAPTVVFVGRLIPAKGLHCLIEAWADVLQREPQAQLLVVGHGPYREIAEALSLTQKGKDRKSLWDQGREGEPKYFPDLTPGRDFPTSGSRIHFTGYLEHGPLACLLPCADVAVVPSLVPEAGPMVLLEAAACGCFPLGVYQGGMANNLDALGAGLEKAAQEAMRLPADPAELTKELGQKIAGALALSGNSRQTIRQTTRARFDWSKLARDLAAALDHQPSTH